MPSDMSTLQATKFRGLVFIATSEFFGAEEDRLPAIFWAIVDPSAKLCSPSLANWGVVASINGLSLAYPVITGRHDCGAFLAFAYGGNTTIELNGETYPAYAGAYTYRRLWLFLEVTGSHQCDGSSSGSSRTLLHTMPQELTCRLHLLLVEPEASYGWFVLPPLQVLPVLWLVARAYGRKSQL